MDNILSILLLFASGWFWSIVDSTHSTPETVPRLSSSNTSLHLTLKALEEYYDEQGEDYEIEDPPRSSTNQTEAPYSEGFRLDLENDEDDDADFKEELEYGKKARWSYAPAFAETICRAKCRENDKPFGRLLGTRCQCLCPLNARELGLCDVSGSCDKFCSKLGYFKGGDCVYNGVCFCYCKKTDKYDVNKVYT